MADQNPVPTAEWVDNLKLVLLGVPLTTIFVRWVAKYLKNARIEEHKDWLRSEDGKLHMKSILDYWWKHRHDPEQGKD